MLLIAFDSIFRSVRLARSPASAESADRGSRLRPSRRRRSPGPSVGRVNVPGGVTKGRRKLDYASIRSLGTGTLDQNQPEHLQNAPHTPPSHPKQHRTPRETSKTPSKRPVVSPGRLPTVGTRLGSQQPASSSQQPARCIKFEPQVQIRSRWPTDGPPPFRVIYTEGSNTKCTKHHRSGV